MSLCAHCVSGVRHEGTPEGKNEKIAGIDCYVATPTVEYPKDKVVLMLSDVFGLTLPNNLLLADDFARNGFKVIIPDCFDGEPVPADGLDPDSDYDYTAWKNRHSAQRAVEILRAVIGALKAEDVTKFAGLGYCFGGRVGFLLAFEGAIDTLAVSHPSFLSIPDDLKKYAEVSKTPLLINSCTIDNQFPLEAQAQADEILANFAPGYKRTYWEGCTHGFAVRGDLSDPKVKAGKEGSFKATVEWLIEKF